MQDEPQPSSDRQFSRHIPCRECPFSRTCEPGVTGGSEPTVYVGQAHGPFLLYCHLDRNYDRAAAGTPSNRIAQCAGAAIFRSNLGLDEMMPAALHHLPADAQRVFATAAELLAHHTHTSVATATENLRQTPPHRLLQIEIRKLRADQISPLPRESGSTSLLAPAR